MVFLTLTGREDWDSALAHTTANPFFYPSVGLSGVISQMAKMPKWVNYLKTRLSWAKVGSLSLLRSLLPTAIPTTPHRRATLRSRISSPKTSSLS